MVAPCSTSGRLRQLWFPFEGTQAPNAYDNLVYVSCSKRGVKSHLVQCPESREALRVTEGFEPLPERES
jgi:hypothetical protein